jgi:ketosteroid isomerase-like protein
MNQPPTPAPTWTPTPAVTPSRCDDARVLRIVDWFESLTPATLDQLPSMYAEQARFKDPFNAVQGVPAIRAIFSHMFKALDQPRFVIHDVIVQGDQCFLTWDFHFQLKQRGTAITIHGGSHLKLDADGRITLHRDYWDAAEELYAKLPLIGALMRWLRRRASSA